MIDLENYFTQQFKKKLFQDLVIINKKYLYKINLRKYAKYNIKNKYYKDGSKITLLNKAYDIF